MSTNSVSDMSIKAEKIGYCGIKCDECPAYLATKEDDASKLALGGQAVELG